MPAQETVKYNTSCSALATHTAVLPRAFWNGDFGHKQ